MGGFCLLYLLMILLMRSGDVETNPGPDRIVSEMEFLKLSKQIEPSYYKEVGINLDISIAELGQIKEHSQNTSDALMTVFTRWKDKQPPGTDIRALLAEGLKRIDLGSLSGELLAGSLVSSRTGAPATMSGSQTQPLSRDQIKRCADDFKSKYRTTLCKIRADPLDPNSTVQFDDMHTNLVLKEEYRQYKRPLEYRDLFDLKVNGEFPKRIMVQGEAGAGKTTFCSKIAWDWINDSPVLPKFVWVLVVPFREAKQYTMGEIAKSYLSKDNPATACQITEYIRSNPKDVFIAFDGLDEFGGKVVQQKKAGSKSEFLQPQFADQTKARGSSSERGDIALTDILRSDELATCPVLVTSRPWKVTEIRWDNSLRKHYTFIHVEGFSKENVEVYIRKYFEDDVATAEQVIQLTRDNDIISENMAPFPIYIAMLCLMWRELSVEKREMFKLCQTFSQIFDNMFEFLKVHYAQKAITDLGSPSFTAYLARIKKLMEPVAKVAFIGLLENTLIFKEDDFKQCSDSMETACRVGVLSKEKKFIIDKSSLSVQSTFFFPHKLFQEYMAGVHLASLYELDHNEFNRLIEQVVLPRKEEFRFLLYFTVSQNKAIANHVMKCMVQDYNPRQEKMDFLVDVSFESQELGTAALVKGGVSSMTLNTFMPTHTIAGYVFTGLYVHVDEINLSEVDEMIGPTTSHNMAKIICSAPSLKDVTLSHVPFHSDFYVVLAKEGNKSKVHTLKLEDVQCPTPASSHHLVEALCSMPKLTDLTLEMDLNEEFYSTLKAKASSIQVQTLKLEDIKCPTPASSHHLVEALCSMPKLTDLTLGMDLNEEFYSTLKAKASSIQVQTLELEDVQCPTPASSHYLAEALCSMPNLIDLTLGMDLNEEFYCTLKAKAPSIQVQTLKLEDIQCPTPASSHHLVEALCSMPKLTDLTLEMDLNEEFYSTLKAKASSIQVRTLKLEDVQCPTPASSHHLVEALCSMPKLTDLTLKMDLNEEFYSTLKAKASSIQLTKTKRLLPKGTSSLSVNEPSGCEATPSRTETRDIQQTTEEIHAQYEFQAEDGGVRDGNQVHWNFLTDSPRELTLQDNEAVISCGIRFSPSGAKFSKPIKVTLDHNAHFSNPRHAGIVFYTRNKDSKSFERIPASTGSYPRCHVRAKDLDLYVDHFCDWWIVAVYNWYFVGKRVNCLPYVRPPVRKESIHFVCLCIYDDLWGVIKKMEKEMTANKMIFPSQQMFVEWKHGDINIKLFDGPKGNENEIDEQTLGKKDINLVDRKHFSFELKPLDPGASPEILKFSLNQRKSCSKDLSDPTLIQFILPYGDMGTTTAEAQAAGVSMPTRTDLVSDRILDKLSRHMPPGTYTTLCTELDIEYNEAKGILLGFKNSYQMATRDCLAQWKTRTGGNMVQLKEILQKAEVGDLVKYMYIK